MPFEMLCGWFCTRASTVCYRISGRSIRLWLLLFFCVTSLPAWTDAVDFQNRSISLALSAEPPDLNSLTSTDSVSGFVLTHVMEGLLRYDEQGNLVAGVAEDWHMDAQGATFRLRKDARWSDGSLVTAHDFVYAWRTALSPVTASEYAFILFPIRNAQAINEGKMAPEALAVRAVDEFTLQVDFHQPCPYFLGLTAFRTLFPVKRSYHQQRLDIYGAEADQMLYNGPFTLQQWVHGASLVMEKNPHYWNRESIALNRINVPYMTADPVVHLNLFRAGNIAMVDGMGSDHLEVALKERLQIKSFLDGAIFYLEFNHQDQHITANRWLRKTIQAVIDVNELVYRVIATPGTRPARSIFASWLMGVDDTFVREYPPPVVTPSIEKARHYLQRAKRELGVTALPPLRLLADDSPGGQKVTQYLQRALQQSLGLEVKVDMQIFKQRLAKMSSGDFDMVIAGWGPDYNDPLTYGDLFFSGNMNNRGRYNSEVYDEAVLQAQSAVDPLLRMQAFARMQRLLVDDVIILPLYERGRSYIEHPQLRGVIRRAIGGDPYFYSAFISPETEKDP